MKTDDLNYVEYIANRSFPTPWSVKTFEREIEINEHGFYWVLVVDRCVSDVDLGKCSSKAAEEKEGVVSYGGYWLLGEDAHIVTIATHSEWRQQGLGKLLLILMMQEAANAGVETVTLEVRESNQVAIRLYTQLGFNEEGRRKEYYTKGKNSSEKEDALILTYSELQSESSRSHLSQARTNVETRVAMTATFTE